MKKTLATGRTKTKNLARNIFAGGFLATSVANTDLVENLSTSITKPTANILHHIENTSTALGNVLQQTSQGNILHTAGNIVTAVPRATASIAEGALKTVGSTTQYIAGLNQTIGNSYITAGESTNQTLSTADTSPDIPQKEINLNNIHDLERNGDHRVAGKNYTGSKYAAIRRLNNVKSSVINTATNTLRIGTDIVSAGTQRVRGVVESLGQIPKDIKSSRSGVFVKGQSFGSKCKKFFTEGIRGSVKGIAKGAVSMANEGVAKTTAAVLGVGANFVGRMGANVIKPLFSTTPRKDHSDNGFAGTARFSKLQGYYSSTPRTNKESVAEDKKDAAISEKDAAISEKDAAISEKDAVAGVESVSPDHKQNTNNATENGTTSPTPGTTKKESHPDTVAVSSDPMRPATGAKDTAPDDALPTFLSTKTPPKDDLPSATTDDIKDKDNKTKYQEKDTKTIPKNNDKSKDEQDTISDKKERSTQEIEAGHDDMQKDKSPTSPSTQPRAENKNEGGKQDDQTTQSASGDKTQADAKSEAPASDTKQETSTQEQK